MTQLTTRRVTTGLNPLPFADKITGITGKLGTRFSVWTSRWILSGNAWLVFATGTTDSRL